MNTVYQFPYLWEALDIAKSLTPVSMEASKSRTPLTAVYQLGMMSLYSEAVYSAEWLNGIELELWEYFSQNIDPMLIDSSGREEYAAIKMAAIEADGWWVHEGDQFRFYPQDEWVARVGQAWSKAS
jgi:hypothetical protein